MSKNFRQESRHRMIVVLALVGCYLLLMTVSARAQGTGYWHTSGNQILDSNNQPVRMAGVNWYGFETTDHVIHGLWAKDYKAVLNTIKNNGYNVIRIPFSNEMVESNPVPTNLSFNNNGPINTDLQGLSSLQILDKIVAAAGAIGLRVVLDNHRSEAGNSAESSGLWYTSSFPESAWINDWVALTNRYLNNTTVIGMDLRNEPHNATSGGSCWGCGTNTNDWRLAAERAGNAILGVNPHLLIFVEGTDCFNGDCDWWGGNLQGVAQFPVTLNVANQLVYSAHDYGPSLFQQPWFNSSTTAATLQAHWVKDFAFIYNAKTAPVWVGEFGTGNGATDVQDTTAGSEGQWFSDLVQFLSANPAMSWTYWALNGEDSFAILDSNYDATPVSAAKQQLLASIQFPLGGGSTAPTISSINPTSAAPGASITITGTNFSATANANTVRFGTATGMVTAASSTSLSVTVPNIAAGAVNVTVSVNGVTSNAVSFTVTGTPQPDFSLKASPATLSVAQGASGSSTITVSPVNGFTGTVSLAASGLPAGVTASFNPASTTGASTLTFAASSTAAAGAANVTITGASGSLSHTVTVALTITSNQTDFSLSASPATLSVAQGAGGSSTITVAPVNGFTGSVAFAASGLPTGVTASFNPASTTGTSTVTFTASSTAATGTANVTVTGTSGSLSHTTRVSLTITAIGNGTGGVTLATVINSNSPFYDDEGVKVTNTGAITALSITINVQNTGGMSFSGQYNTVGGSIVDTHSSTATVITYQFGLSAGQTLNPGSYLFDAQMSASGTAHPTSGDTFTVTYTTGGQTFTQTGHF
jgi:endoglucanase